MHFALETGDVPVTKVFAQLLNFLQLQQVYPQHLNGFHHLKISTLKISFKSRKMSIFYQIVDVVIVGEKWLAFTPLMLNESLNI